MGKLDDKKINLVIPIYLDTKIVLDTLAIMNDGLSMVKSITTSESSADKNASDYDARVGVKNLFSILNMSGGYSNNKEGSESASNIEKYEKIHTMVSLFAEMKNGLNELELIKKDFCSAGAGDFVELNGDMKINPLSDLLNNSKDFIALSNNFNNNNNNNNNNQNKKKGGNNNNLGKQIDILKRLINPGDQLDVILHSENVNAVIPVNEAYFINADKKELTTGKYKVLGKIVDKAGSGESISTLRYSPLSLLSDDILKMFIEAFDNDDFNKMLKEPIKFDVEGPVLLIKPIAIYI